MVYTIAPSNHIFHSFFPITHPINLLHSPHHHSHHRRRLSHITIPSSHFSTGIFHSHSALDQHRFNNQNPQIPDNSIDYGNRDNTLLDRIYNSSSVNLNRTPTEIGIEDDTDGDKGESCSGIFTNMWWANLKAAVGQRVNMQGILFSVSVIVRNRQWMIPHVSVQDVRCIDWAALKRMGFEGVVFDKDNTLTVPYSLSLWGPLVSSVESCKAVFGNNIAVFSNSAGLREYDPDGRKARAIEFAIGIRVIRHKMKKPAGSAEDIERHFGCDSSKLIMVGDRPFTDIVYGNRNGCLTILTAPLSLAEETFIVKQVRKIELALLKWLLKRGLKPVNPRLVSDALDCVKEPPHV